MAGIKAVTSHTICDIHVFVLEYKGEWVLSECSAIGWIHFINVPLIPFHPTGRFTPSAEVVLLHNNQQPVSLNPLEDIHVDDFSLVIIPVIILHPHFTLWVLFFFFFHVQPFWIEAKDIPLWMENRHAEKSETINTSRMYLRLRMRVSFRSRKEKKKTTLFSLLSFVKAPRVLPEWKPRFSCFLWTSLSSGIVLPRSCGAGCLYMASLIPTYFQFAPLFSIRAVIDLHLSLNLHEDEDRER